MNKEYQNSNPDSEMDFLQSLPKIEMSYTKSKDDVWKDLLNKTAASKPPVKTIKLQWVKYAAAACLFLLLTYAGFINIYTKTIYCPKGKHMSVLLPDQSQIELNAGSNLRYKPYLWKYYRKVKFEGEAFFKITKGSKFEIESDLGKTYILGTSFNIYARGKEYKVTCYTGKVKVVSKITSDNILLLPNDYAYVTKNGNIKLEKEDKAAEQILWRSNLFRFTRTPLQSVFEEIELQYDINITEKGKFKLNYTGNFSKEKSVESVLHKVCMPLGLNFAKGPGKNYIITQNNP
ncbi:FecR family protein [Ancylomarina longa]|uniref:FecR family protein n=1 Tax=Ancylomarina longa TaxID=2487017 RepID=A0A434AEX1_9BACT|nr:FecR family protein [Ancylomarina longa]RUT72924.1 FecR family protein [Ancylomarina longa]